MRGVEVERCRASASACLSLCTRAHQALTPLSLALLPVSPQTGGPGTARWPGPGAVIVKRRGRARERERESPSAERERDERDTRLCCVCVQLGVTHLENVRHRARVCEDGVRRRRQHTHWVRQGGREWRPPARGVALLFFLFFFVVVVVVVVVVCCCCCCCLDPPPTFRLFSSSTTHLHTPTRPHPRTHPNN